MKRAIILIMLFLIPVITSAQPYHIKLLAVSEDNKGSDADLYLELVPGNGRVFLDTFPLTKYDTQISTRFAKEIACSYLNINCNNYDFIYTIRAKSTIIGGPSAGAAMSLLTVLALQGLKYENTTAVTGTINSGGLIGPVGGVKEKLEAAKDAGLKKVLVPKSTSLMTNISNLTVNLRQYASEIGIELVEVSTLSQSLSHFSPSYSPKKPSSISIDAIYSDTMQMLAQDLCNRSSVLRSKMLNLSNFSAASIDSDFFQTEEKAMDYVQKANLSYRTRDYYSAASFCFSSNFNFAYLALKLQNLSDTDIIGLAQKTQGLIDEFNLYLANISPKTMTDLQAYMIVKERLTEAQDSLNTTLALLDDNSSYLQQYAYSVERLYSAKSWSAFFNKPGKRFDINQEFLKSSCLEKIDEAEERILYSRLMVPTVLEDASLTLDHARIDYEHSNYELCLFKASKAKAEANAFLSASMVSSEEFSEFLNSSFYLVSEFISLEAEKGIFPILGYSYYELASSLSDSDPYSAHLFLNYALELSNLEIYFKEKPFITLNTLHYNLLLIFIFGMITGLSLSKLFNLSKKAKIRRNYRINRK